MDDLLLVILIAFMALMVVCIGISAFTDHDSIPTHQQIVRPIQNDSDDNIGGLEFYYSPSKGISPGIDLGGGLHMGLDGEIGIGFGF